LNAELNGELEFVKMTYGFISKNGQKNPNAILL